GAPLPQRGFPLPALAHVAQDRLYPPVRQPSDRDLAREMGAVFAAKAPLAAHDPAAFEPCELGGDARDFLRRDDVLEARPEQLVAPVSEHVAAGGVGLDVAAVRVAEEYAVH